MKVKVRDRDSSTKPVAEEEYSNDSIKQDMLDILNNVVTNNIVPTLLGGAESALQAVITMIFHGPDAAPKQSQKTQYNKVYHTSTFQPVSKTPTTRVRKNSMNLDNFTFDNIDDANYVLGEMIHKVETEGFVTLMYLYRSLIETDVPTPYTYNNYGWTDLRKAAVYRLGDGRYYISIPDAVYLK